MTTANTMQGEQDLDQIIIRSWPKVIFLYPILLACLICGLIQQMTTDSATGVSPYQETLGLIFYVVFCVNILVIAFEFSRFKTLAIFFFVLMLVFMLLWLSTRWEVFQFIREFFSGFHLKASSSLYYAIAIYLLIVLGCVFITTRFNYWIIRSNEILHKEGFLGDVKRFPSPNLKMTKEISDVFEFILLGAGRIVLYPASEKQAIVLDHVLRVNAAEAGIQELLSALSVEVENHRHGHESDHDAEDGVGG